MNIHNARRETNRSFRKKSEDVTKDGEEIYNLYSSPYILRVMK